MSTVQVKGLISAREKFLRAKKEMEVAKLKDIAYRGVHYAPSRVPSETHGSYSYRGISYVK